MRLLSATVEQVFLHTDCSTETCVWFALCVCVFVYVCVCACECEGGH